MINLFAKSRLNYYQQEDSLDFDISVNGNLPLLAPTKELNNFLKQETSSNWEIFSQVYKDYIKTSKVKGTLIFLTVLSKAGKIINLMCDCNDSEFCHRSLIAQELIEMGNTVYLE